MYLYIYIYICIYRHYVCIIVVGTNTVFNTNTVYSIKYACYITTLPAACTPTVCVCIQIQICIHDIRCKHCICLNMHHVWLCLQYVQQPFVCVYENIFIDIYSIQNIIYVYICTKTVYVYICIMWRGDACSISASCVFVCVYMNIYIFTGCIYVYGYIDIYIHVYTCTYTCAYVFV